MIIIIGSEKGGTGKTTLVTNLAAMRAKSGRDVLIVDTDIQGSASDWSTIRGENESLPRIACLQKFGKGLQAEIRDLSRRYEDILIDAGGRDSVELRAGLVVSHKALIPLQASQFDIWSLKRVAQLIEQAGGFNPDLQAQLVINRASSHPGVSEIEDAEAALQTFDHLALCTSVIKDRIAFRKATKHGCAVTEVKPVDAKATAELEALYHEVFGENS